MLSIRFVRRRSFAFKVEHFKIQCLHLRPRSWIGVVVIVSCQFMHDTMKLSLSLCNVVVDLLRDNLLNSVILRYTMYSCLNEMRLRAHRANLARVVMPEKPLQHSRLFEFACETLVYTVGNSHVLAVVFPKTIKVAALTPAFSFVFVKRVICIH